MQINFLLNNLDDNPVFVIMTEVETIYRLDFNKMRNSNEIKGVYWDSVPENIRFRSHILAHIERMNKGSDVKYEPILYINESINEHYTQIMHILKQYFTDYKSGFLGLNSFTKETLVENVKRDYFIYKDNYPDGEDFVELFPKKIDEFIEKFCRVI